MLYQSMIVCLPWYNVGVRSNIFAETFGPNSHCIDHGMSTPWSVNGQQFPNFGGSGCYQVCVMYTMAKSET